MQAAPVRGIAVFAVVVIGFTLGTSACNRDAASGGEDSGTDAAADLSASPDLGPVDPTTCHHFQPAVPVSLAASTRNQRAANPHSVVLGDLDGDGSLDAVVAAYSASEIRVLLGDGTGRFSGEKAYACDTGPEQLELTDINGDGHLDVVAAVLGGGATSGGEVAVFLGDGKGGLAPAITTSVDGRIHWVATGDLNGDGRADVVAVGLVMSPTFDLGSPSALSDTFVLLGNGDGRFTPQRPFLVGGDPYAAALRDANLDGKLDLLVSQRAGGVVALLRGDGHGAFTAPMTTAVATSPYTLLAEDLDGDGTIDVATPSDTMGGVSLLRGGPNGFQPMTRVPAGASTYWLASGDFNHDGRRDIAATIVGAGVGVLLNAGAGAFQLTETCAAGSEPSGLTSGDINKDGKEDIAIVSYGSNQLSVLLAR